MMFLLLILAVLAGACVGSFCNVLVVRMKEGTSIGGRSRCVACRRALGAGHLVPVVSWIWLRARCAYCKEPIHWQYPAVEVAGACIALVSLVVGMDAQGGIRWDVAFFTALFFFALLVLTVTDLRWGTVPVGFASGVAIFLGAWRSFTGIVSGDANIALFTVVGMGVSWAFLAGLVAITGGRMMGDGDPSVGFLIGAALGWPLGPVALLLAFVIGGACATVLLVAGVVGRKTTIPFVPFLALGALVVTVWHEPILRILYGAFI